MISYEGVVVIRRPVSEVFQYLTTFENFPQWSDTNSVTLRTNGNVGVGTRMLIDMGKGPMRSKAEFETVGWEPDRRWAFRTLGTGPVGWEGSFTFEEIDAQSTRLTSRGEVTLRGWRRLLETLARTEIRNGERAELEVLKGLLEGSSDR